MDVRLPDGTIIRNVPEGTTRTQLTERLQRNGYDLSRLSSAAGGSQDGYQPYAEISVSAAPEKPLGGFWSALFESAQTLGLADEAAAFAANPTEENRKALLAAGESKFRNVGFGEGENWAAFRQLLGGSLGFLVAPAAAATAASVATTPIGGIATGFGTSTAQYQAQNLLRQAQEQERAIAEGRTPQELELGKSVAASTAQAGLDTLQFGLFAKLLRAFPLVRNLVSSEKEIAEDAARTLVEAARQGTLKTTGRGVAQGVAGGVAFEVPQEIAQQALERWQAGLSLTDEEAQEEFKQAAIGAAVLGPLMGGAAGGIRAKAEQAQAQDLRRASDAAQTRLEQIVAKPTPTPAEQAEAEFIRANADNPTELVKRYSTEALMAQGQAEQEQTTAQPPPPPEIETADALLNAPPKVSAEAAPEAMRAEPMRLTDEQVEEEIVKMEQQQEQLATLLFDPAEIQTQAAAANVPVEVYTADLTKAYDDLTTRVDIFNKNFMQRLRGEAPAAPTTSTPPPPAPADVDVATEDLVATEAAPVEAAPSATPSAPIAPFAERPKQETMFSETVVTPSNVTSLVGRRQEQIADQEEQQDREFFTQKTLANADDLVKTYGPQVEQLQSFVARANKVLAETRFPNSLEAANIKRAIEQYEGIIGQYTDILEKVEQSSPRDWLDLGKFNGLVRGFKGNIKGEVDQINSNLNEQLGQLARPKSKKSNVVNLSQQKDIRARALGVLPLVPTIKAISEATGLNQPQAAAIMRGFVDEGIVERVGNKFRLVEAKKSEVVKPVKAQKAVDQGIVGERSPEAIASLRAAAENPDTPVLKSSGYKPPAWDELPNGFGARQYVLEGKYGRSVVQEIRAPKVAGKEPAVIRRGIDYDGTPFGEKEATGTLDEIYSGVAFSDFNEYFAAKNRAALPSTTFSTTPPEAPRGTAPEPVAGETVSRADIGGAELPVSRAGTDRRGAAESGVEGLGVPSAAAERVDERAESVEPALEKGPAKTPQQQRRVTSKAGEKVVSNAFNEQFADYFKAIVNYIGLGDTKILLVSKRDLLNSARKETVFDKYGLYGEPNAGLLIKEAQNEKTFGSVIRLMGTDGYVIVLDDQLAIEPRLEALGHELGHIVEWEAFSNADEKTKQEILDAHAAWMLKNGQEKTAKVVKLLRARNLAKLDLAEGYENTVLNESDLEYLKSFREWFADNVSKWMTTSEKPLGVVEQFFASLAKRIRKIVAAFAGTEPESLPDSAVKKFLDGLEPMNTVMTASLIKKSGNPKPETVQQSRRILTSTINSVGSTVNNLPKMNKEIYDGVRSTLDSTRISDAMRRGLYAFLSLPQQVQLFVKELPTLRELLNVLNVRASSLKDRKEVLDRNIRKWNDAIKEHAQYKDEFYEVAHESTRLQIEFNVQKFVNHPLTQRFNRLPPALQKVYWEMLSSYRDMADEYLALISKNLSPREAVRLQREMAKKRLRVYLPLYREGDYWMRYQDANNDTVVQSFKSNYERELAWKEAVANGAKSSSKQNFTRVDEFFEGGGPGTFFNKVLEDLNKRGAPQAVKRSLYELYLDQIPASSVRQLYRKRDGYKGYESDLMNVYSTVATRMANQLINLEYIPEIDKVFNDIQVEADKYAASGQSGNRAVPELIKNLEGQMEYLRDPGNGSLVNALSSFSYYWYIIGNISTAVINTTQLPMVVYPMLAGKYGVDKATSAMSDATKQYFKGGFDNDNIPGGYKKFPADFSFGVGVPPNSPLGRLYKAAVRQSAIRRSTGYDLIQGRKKTYGMGDYIGLKAKMEQILGWTFQNSERFNREVTLIAAFNLEMQKNGGNVDAAIKTALDLVNDTHGTVLTETSPRVFQTGFGKVAFTFKNFAQTQIYLQAKLLREAVKGETPEVQRMAAKQMLGIMTMAFMFAGLHGMPFYSAATLLADILADIFGDDDDPLKSNEIIRQSLGSLVHKGPVNEALMVDIASRTGFNSLLWRDDDKRLEEVGPILFAAEQIFGPTYAAFANMYRGYKDFKEGHIDRAIEATTPAVIRNGLKSVRFASEGAQSRSGEKIYDDFNTYELAMQAFGFTPVELARRSESAGALASRKSNLTQRKTALLDRLYLARINGDKEGQREAMEAIRKFNSNEFVRKTRNVIGFDDIQESLKRRMKNARTSVYGINVPEKARRQLEEMYKLEEDR